MLRQLPSAQTSKSTKELINNISARFAKGRTKAAYEVNKSIIHTYWDLGRYIFEFEQEGQTRAKYGKSLLERLSRDLTMRLGKGFSRPNLSNMRLFYLRYPIRQTLSDKLSWSHYCELISISDEIERDFYFKQSSREKWSVAELKRQKKSGLFLRLALSEDKNGILKLASKGKVIEKPEDAVKSLYVLEFLNIPAPYQISELKLESRLIEQLMNFLLELGKGFAYVGRQYRITINNVHYRVDLVFYHYILKCFVLIDLKIDQVEHYDISQMNMYMGYFASEENGPDDNPPNRILL
jgi:predicted nuclease of restriction endonuclease-like (RecB) superfamily